MKRGVIFVSAALTMMFSSCGLYSKYDKQSSVEANLYGEVVAQMNSAQPDSLTMGNISWRDMFSDSRLQGYIELALANNTDLRSAELRVEEAAASLMTARLSYLPTLALSPQGATGGLVDGSATYHTYTLPVTASWEVDIFGRVTNQKLQTKMLFEQQKYTAQAMRTEIVAAVANLYYTITMLEEQLQIAIVTSRSWEESYTTAEAMMEAGLMNQAGLSQIKASLHSVQMAVVNIEDSLKTAQNSMCSLLAITPRSIEGGELFDIELPSQLSIGVPLQLLSSRPDVMAAESALAASFYSENMARSSFYPSVSLSGSLGWTNSFGSAILDPAEFVYSAVAQLVQPIFNKGLNRAQLKIAKAEFDIARMAFEQKLLDSGIEVNNALTSLVASQVNSKLYASQVDALRSAANSTMLMMKHGSTTYLEVLTAQQTLFNAQLGQVSNRFDQMQSVITLYKSLGGGRF